MQQRGISDQGLRRIAQTQTEANAVFYKMREKLDTAMTLIGEASTPECLDELTGEGADLLTEVRQLLWVLWDDFDNFSADSLRDDLSINEFRDQY